MPPAARITDFHACPMVTPGTPPIPHVGGPIIKGSFNVLTGKLPQARVGDMAVCVGPPDTIVKGSSGVFVNKMPAARIGDSTAHGGTIVAGLPTVIIGESKSISGGGAAVPAGAVLLSYSDFAAQVHVLAEAHKSGAPFCEYCFKKALEDFFSGLLGLGSDTSKPSPAKHYGSAIKIEGDDTFREKTIAELDKIKATATGGKLLEALDASGKTITIKPTSKGNSVTGLSAGAMVNAKGEAGKGSDSTVNFNPDVDRIGEKDWQKRPSGIGLAHELIHAHHASTGTIDVTKVDNDHRPDPTNPKLHAKEKAEEVKTVGVSPFDKEPFTENKIRAEWDPVQPKRPWY